MKHRRALLLSVLLVLLFAAAGGLSLWQAKRQYARDRQLITALRDKNAHQAFALVQAGAHPNTPVNVAPPPSLPELLHRLLHSRSVNMDDNFTAFTLACGAGWEWVDGGFAGQRGHPNHLQLVQAMLAHGAKVNTPTKGIPSALWEAVAGDHAPIVELLLKHGADMNVQEQDGTTLLIVAAQYQHGDMIHLLLAHGAKVNLQDQQGETALHLAVSENMDKDVIQQLLAHGSDPNQPDKEGDTPLNIAQEEKCSEIVTLLKHGRK